MTSTDLATDIEQALMDALQGDPWSTQLAGRLKTVARAVLLRHGHDGATVAVTRAGDDVRVHVSMPTGGPRVARLTLSLTPY